MRRQTVRRPFRPIAKRKPDNTGVAIEAYTYVVQAYHEAAEEAKRRHAFAEMKEHIRLADYHARTLTELRKPRQAGTAAP